MNYYWTIIVIFLSSLTSFYFDKYKNCFNRTVDQDIFNSLSSLKSNSLLFLHHLLNIFANFGWITTSKPILYLYIFAPIVTAFHWITNNGKCSLTEDYNRLCGLPTDLPFNDVFNLIGFKKYPLWNTVGHYLYLLISLIICMFKIMHV